jgi:transcriptional regulator with XRE-family HTH domain
MKRIFIKPPLERITPNNSPLGMVLRMPRHVYLAKDLGPRLRRLRLERGWTQEELAKLLGCSQRAVVYYETTSKCPPAPIVAKLAAAFDLSMEALLGEDEVTTKRAQHDPDLFQDPEDRRLWKKFRLLRDLPERDQLAIFRMIVNATGARTSDRTA